MCIILKIYSDQIGGLRHSSMGFISGSMWHICFKTENGKRSSFCRKSNKAKSFIHITVILIKKKWHCWKLTCVQGAAVCMCWRMRGDANEQRRMRKISLVNCTRTQITATATFIYDGMSFIFFPCNNGEQSWPSWARKTQSKEEEEANRMEKKERTWASDAYKEEMNRPSNAEQSTAEL